MGNKETKDVPLTAVINSNAATKTAEAPPQNYLVGGRTDMTGISYDTLRGRAADPYDS